jgi:hypothetical protein
MMPRLMGWTAYYQILRDRPLNEEEIETLHDFIRRTNRDSWDGESFNLKMTRAARPDHVLGYGAQKFPWSDASDDQRRLLKVLTALFKLVDDVEVRVEDDFNTFGWDDERNRAAMDGPTTELVAIKDYDSFHDPAKLVGNRPEPLPIAVAELLEGKKPSRKNVAAALVEHAHMTSEDGRQVELANVLRATPAQLRVQAGLDVFDKIDGKTETLQIIADAELQEVAPIVVDFLTTWKDAHGVHFYERLTQALGSKTLDALARVPAVEKEMLADLRAAREEDASEMTYRCASAAADLLGRAGSRHVLHALVDTASEIRFTSELRPFEHRAQVLSAILAALLRFDAPEIVPTLVYAVASRTTVAHLRGAAIVKLARLAPQRVMPFIEHLVTTGEATSSVLEALQIIGGDEATVRLHELDAAADAIAVNPPEELVAHVHRDVREAALTKLDERRDQSTLLSFIAAAALHNALAERFDTPTSSWKTPELLSALMRKQPFERQVAWLRGKGGAAFPPQVIWPSIERVLADGPKAVALTYPSPWPLRQLSWMEDVRKEEAAMLQSLRDELGLVKLPVPPVPEVALPNLGKLFDPTPTPVTPMPFPADPAPTPTNVIDELLTAIGKEQVPSAELLARADMSTDIAQMNTGDAARAVARILANRMPDELTKRLLAKLPEIHGASAVRDICDGVFAWAIEQPGMAERLLEMWEQAFAVPWEYKTRANAFLFKVASHPVIFTRMVDELAAPDDGPLRGRTTGAIELVSEAAARKAEALSVIVARVRRDRGRPRDLAQWRGDALRALKRLSLEDGVPTAILELAELASMDVASDVFELLAMFPSGIGALQQAVDLPKCARYAVRDLCWSSLVGEESRRKYLTHPFWKLRLLAADRIRDAEESKRATAEIWTAIDAARLPIPPDDARYMRPEGLQKVKHKVPAVPPPRDGMAAACYDYRAWALWAVDERHEVQDAAARVFADELDIAMVERGHMRIAPRWYEWREAVPALPLDRKGRLAWARAQTDAPMPSLLARVRDEGARVVAAELPGPHLVLPPELRKELEERERQIAEVGEALFS